MKTFSVILLNLVFIAVGLALFFLFLGVFGISPALISCTLFGLIASLLIPKLSNKRNDIDA